jgi:hypothetical protein
MSEYWLGGGVPPAECGCVPSPLYKSYWDCFHDKHDLSLIVASSSAGQAVARQIVICGDDFTIVLLPLGARRCMCIV